MPIKNLRRITELFPNKQKKTFKRIFGNSNWSKELLRFFSLVLVLTGVCFFIVLVFLFNQYQKTQMLYKSTVRSLYFWENITREYPNYPQGFYQAGLFALKLRERAKAQAFLEQAVYLDPQFQDARSLLYSIKK